MTTFLDRVRFGVLMAVSVMVMTAAAVLILPVAAVTLGRARRLYAFAAAGVARVLMRVWGIRLAVHGRFASGRQTVFISNHTSTLDLFALAALELPNTRFFLSGFVQKYVPIGVFARLMGTFFTVPQTRPAERTRIFKRAAAVLGRTGESVYLSPEGGRILGGELGPFNKGAFHLAIALAAPVQPFLIYIPPDMDPGRGYAAGAGTIHVHVLPVVETAGWRVDDLVQIKDDMRSRLAERWREIQEAHRADRERVAPADGVAVAR